MKKILITGANSYIGQSFAAWVSKRTADYTVDELELRSSKWREVSFEGYDVVYHLVAIVHVKENDTQTYFRVNRDLAYEVAAKAKSEGVRQFIFLSTMGVYGRETGKINLQTEPRPKTPYAVTKLDAENLLESLQDESFTVAILRPPLVYGYGCKGNYPRLVQLILKLPAFPKVNNKRSMIYIDNLSECVRLLIDKELGGLLFPQNVEHVNTSDLAKQIAALHGKKIVLTKLLNPLAAVGIRLSENMGKVFGSFIYDIDETDQILRRKEYSTCSFPESIARTEIGVENSY